MKALLPAFVVLVIGLALLPQAAAQWTNPHWGVQQSGIPGPAVYEESIEFTPVNESICWGVARSAHHVTRTTDGGATWTSSLVGSPSILYGLGARSASTAWVALDDGVLGTTDGGVSWTRQLTAGLMHAVHFFDDSTGVTFGVPDGGYHQIYTTTNAGVLWTRVSRSNIPEPVNSAEGFIPSNYSAVGNTIWIPTNGGFTEGGSLYKSTDRGRTWSATRHVVTNLGLFVAFKDSLNGLLSGNRGSEMKRTTDGGATWEPTESMPQGMSPLCVSYVRGSSGSYMVTSLPPRGTLDGSAYTLDNGATWTVVDFLPHGKAAFVSPEVGWSYLSPDTILTWTGPPLEKPSTVRESSEGLPIHSGLSQNYPNPFNPSTTIGFKLQYSGFTTLKVFDILGNEVRTLVHEELNAGSYEIPFTASGLASGVYYYRLTFGGTVSTKSLLLLR
jgi:photosystem II stability/assembly factor-like uncharacterized protein